MNSAAVAARASCFSPLSPRFLLPQIRNYNRWAAIYFVFAIIFGNMFALNLFVGAVIDAFNAYSANSSAAGSMYMTESQHDWVATQLMIARARQHLKPSAKPPDSKSHSSFCAHVQYQCHKLVLTAGFQNFIMGCIVVNVMVLASKQAHESHFSERFQWWANMVFYVIFLIEMVIKLIGLGKSYFSSKSNCFDCTVVLACTFAVVAELILNIQVGTLASVARGFRACQALKLVKGFGSMQAIMETIIKNLPMMTNISCVLGLVLFVFAVMAVQVRSRCQRLPLARSGDAELSRSHALLVLACCCCCGYSCLLW